MEHTHLTRTGPSTLNVPRHAPRVHEQHQKFNILTLGTFFARKSKLKGSKSKLIIIDATYNMDHLTQF